MISIYEILPFLIPIILIQVCLQVYCIINLVKRNKVRFNNKLVWGFIILGFQIIGAVSYLVFRGEEE